jgi:hypothetical protein
MVSYRMADASEVRRDLGVGFLACYRCRGMVPSRLRAELSAVQPGDCVRSVQDRFPPGYPGLTA